MGLKILPRPCAGFSLPKTKSIPPKGCLFYFRFRIFSRKIKPFIFSGFSGDIRIVSHETFFKKETVLQSAVFFASFFRRIFLPIFLPHFPSGNRDASSSPDGCMPVLPLCGKQEYSSLLPKSEKEPAPLAL